MALLQRTQWRLELMERQAWYSLEQARRTGTVIWAQADGTEVEVTEVTNVGEPPIGKKKGYFSSYVDRGVVVRCVRAGRPKEDCSLVNLEPEDKF
jgi:hypothetical protein